MMNARKTNKRRVTFNFFPEKIYVTDMIYRVGLLYIEDVHTYNNIIMRDVKGVIT